MVLLWRRQPNKKDPDIPGGRFSYAEGEGIALLGRVTVSVEITPLGKWTYAGDANGVELYREQGTFAATPPTLACSPARIELYRGGRLSERPLEPPLYVVALRGRARVCMSVCAECALFSVCGACKTHGIFFLATIMIRATRTLRAPFVQLQDQAVK